MAFEKTNEFGMYDAVVEYPVKTLAIDMDLPDEVPEIDDENVVVVRRGEAKVKWDNGKKKR